MSAQEAVERARALVARGDPSPTDLAELAELERAIGRARGVDRDRHADLLRSIRALRVAKDQEWARAILGGAGASPPELLRLAKRLAGYKRVGLARRLLDLARARYERRAHPDLHPALFQQSALYTYKDPDLPAGWRLDRALEILGEAGDLATATDPETLGLAGAIHKRRWELDGQRRHLERSLVCYLKGYAQGAPEAARGDVLAYLREDPGCQLDATRDRGYCGVNAAFVLDLLAHEEELEASRLGLAAATGEARRQAARRIREEIVRSVPPLREEQPWLAEEWWFYATVGEAFLGLGRCAEAERWLVQEPEQAGLTVGFDQIAPKGLEVPEWEYESTARQLARLARLQEPDATSEEAFERTAAGRALRAFLQGDDQAVRSAFRGKIGLGLSGGGFRAALFHIGVLARLAELDRLRHLEVLSCVSGGSIVGAHYYLKLRHLLETREDGAIGREDYVRLVQELEREFLAGVQRNVRVRVVADLRSNLRMIFTRGYSRTRRVGELYEREIYARAGDGHQGPRRMRDLLVHPRVGPGRQQEDFHPRDHNWRRRNKVPTLVLNAATLNTGHGWQFTATFMGEPPMPILADIDANERLRRMYYEDAPPPHGEIRLGHAVAASSCVPGLFEPLVLDELYPDRSVRLVDGGVCDNQGVASLLEQDCTVMLVSDGSGQMEAEPAPSRGVLGGLLRANGILQARLREAQFVDAATRRRGGTLRGLVWLHLRQDLPGEAIAWKDCPPHQAVYELEREQRQRDRTGYGIAVELQRKLAAVRTDLDSFSDAEAFALMASGYRIASAQLRAGGGPVTAAEPGPRADWRFLQVGSELEPGSAGGEHLGRLLEVASQKAFKIWRLWKPLVLLKWTLAAAALAGVALAALRCPGALLVPPFVLRWGHGLATAAGLGSVVGITLLGVLARWVFGRRFGRLVPRLARPRETLLYMALGVLMCVFGTAAAWIHLSLFDPLYLWYGRVERIPGWRREDRGGPATTGDLEPSR